MVNDNHAELISAAIDGELVDVDALRDALSTDDGREALVSFILMRAAVAADRIGPPVELPGIPNASRAEERTAPPRRRWRLAAGLASAAAVLLAVVSFWLGATWRSGLSSPRGNMQIHSQESAVDAEGQAARAATLEVTAESDEPPTPTRVLRFTPGVDWHPSS